MIFSSKKCVRWGGGGWGCCRTSKSSANNFVAGDPEIVRQSEFRVLRQNRPVAPAEEGDDAKQAELDEFHEGLDNVAHGRGSHRVRKLLVEAYVRANAIGGARRRIAQCV